MADLTSAARRVVDLLDQVIAPAAVPVALHEPDLSDSECRSVADCVAGGWVSTVGGHHVTELEQRLCSVTGAAHVVATMNATAAQHALLAAMGIGPGDEVLTPALTYVATASAVVQAGAVPHFVDCEPDTVGVDAVRLGGYIERGCSGKHGQLRNRSTGRPVRALIVTHVFGHPAHIGQLAALCDSYNLPLIEDAAEAVGTLYEGRHVGTTGRAGLLSFNGNKIVTTGSGGAVVTDDADLASNVRHLIGTAKLPHPWEYVHDRLGFNYGMPNLNAALGCAQLQRLPDFLTQKRALASAYIGAFDGYTAGSILQEPSGARSNYWLNALLLNTPDPDLRDAILETTHVAGYLTRPAWRPLHLLPPYAGCPRMPLPVAEEIYARCINLPSSARLGRRYVAEN